MRFLRNVSTDTLATSGGLLVLGVSAYLFLLLAGRVLGDEAYAPLGVLWILVFFLGPALLYPVEQELSRALAARGALGQGGLTVFKKASMLAAGLCAALIALLLLASPLILDRLFDGDIVLLISLVLAIISYAAAYVARGVYAGGGWLTSYGTLIGLEGVVRLLAAGALAVAGVDEAGPYGLTVGISPLAAVAIAFLLRTKHRPATGPPADWSEITKSLRNLVAAAFLSQLLVNSAPLVVKYFAEIGEQARAGAFAKAVVITRIPLFLFQAVQAVMLPKLTRLATVGERAGFVTALRNVMVAVGVIGLLGTLGALAIGGELLTLFGSDTGLPRTDMTLLALGNAVFLLCITASQALIAVRGQRDTVVAWGFGVVAFAIVVAIPGSFLLRVELALIIGALVSLVIMLIYVRKRLSRVTDVTGKDLTEALSVPNEHIEP